MTALPLTSPAAAPTRATWAARIAAHPAYPALGLGLLLTPLVSATLLSKFAIPPFGAMGIAIGVLLIIGASLLGLALGQLQFVPQRLVYFVLMVSAFVLVPTALGAPFSLASLLFFVAIHLPYVLGPGAVRGDWRDAVRIYQNLALFIALCGIAQFCLQFVIGPVLAFPLENLLPAEVLVDKFNKQGPLAYGSEIYRSNGIFLLEPSFFSQLLGVAIVAELALYNRLWRLAVMGLALVLSYSGTGLMVLAVCLPLLMVAKQRWDILLLGLIAAVLLALGGELLNLDLFVARANEFNATGSSAFARFVGGFYLFDQFLWDSPLHAFLGFGPGSFKEYAPHSPVPVSEMAMPKMVFEFGLLGAVAYFGFIGWCVFSSSAPWLIRLAVMLIYFLNGNYIAFAHGLALSLLVWTQPRTEHLNGATETHKGAGLQP